MKLIGQLWYIFSIRERIEGSILLLCMALGALFEAVSIGFVAPFIAILNDPKRVFEAPIIQHFLSDFNIRSSQELLTYLGLGLVVAFLLKSGYLIFLYRWLFRYIYEKHYGLTRQLLAGYLKAPYTFHLQRNTAEVIKGTTETIQRFTVGFFTMLMVVLGELLVMLALTILLLAIRPLATIGVMLVLGVPVALIYRAMQQRLAKAGRLADESMASMIQWSEQAISGIKETLIMGRTSFFLDRHSHHTRWYSDSWCTFTLLSNIPRLVIDTIAVCMLVGLSLVILARGQDLQSVLPVLGMFAVAAIRLMPSTNRIAHGLTHLRFHYVTTEVIYNELRELGRVSPKPILIKNGLPLPFEQSLVLEHVCYRYPSMHTSAVDDVSLEIPKGHWVAFVGPTGAGKTTLVDMMLGLFAPTSGRILVDGVDLRDNIAAWQQHIGYVPQDVYMLDDNVRRNVAFGSTDQEIDDERVWQALRAAQADDLVRSLRNGLDSMIGQRGDRLSGGERQRLGLARALYRDTQVLVVDEGTANLDYLTEAAIARTLAGLRGEKTIIVIAHRLALVRDCDEVYLLQQGKLHNSGTFADLLETDDEFRQLVGIRS